MRRWPVPWHALGVTPLPGAATSALAATTPSSGDARVEGTAGQIRRGPRPAGWRHGARHVAPPLRWPGPPVSAPLALVGVAVLWGTSLVATKPVLAAVPPLTLSLVRVVVALAVLLPLVRRAGRRPARGREAALLGLTGVALAIVCQNLGLRHAGAADASLILGGGIPVLTVGLAALVLRERLTRRALAGAGASLVGVATLVLIGDRGGRDALAASLLGDGLLLAAALALAAHTVIGRRAFAGGDLLPLLAGSFGYGALFLLPAAAVEVARVGLAWPPLPVVGLILYLGAGCSALALALAAYGLARLEAGRVAVILNLEPVVGVGVAALLLGEPVTAGHLAGGGLIAAGAWLASRARAAPAVRGPTRAAAGVLPADSATSAGGGAPSFDRSAFRRGGAAGGVAASSGRGGRRARLAASPAASARVGP